MQTQQYTCAVCSGRFVTENAEQAAVNFETFHGVKHTEFPTEIRQVCDQCYKEFMLWALPQIYALEQCIALFRE